MIEDYKKDMAELSEMSSNFISMQKREINERDRLIWLLIRAAGGRIAVDEFDIMRFDAKKSELIREIRQDTMQEVYKALVKT
jgi:hypothetical protein